MKALGAPRGFWQIAYVASICLQVLFTSAYVQADTYWIDGNGDWDVGANWDNGVPQAGDSAFLNQPLVTVNYVSGSNPTLEYVEVNDLFGSSLLGPTSLIQAQDILTANYMTVGNSGIGYYNLSGTGSLVVNNNLTVSASPRGDVSRVIQDGGSVSISGGYGALTLGRDAGAYGTYTLNNGNLTLVGSEEYIGDAGFGGFSQSGGTHELNGVMYLGVQSTGEGAYVMIGGRLTAGAVGGGIVLGEWGGYGQFVQYGGEVAVNEITLGRQTGSTGVYDLSGGTLNVIGNIVNGDGTGSINIDGGTLNVTGSIDVDNFRVGYSSGSYGSFALFESGQSLNAGSETIGGYGAGMFEQSGGTNTTGELILGANAGSSGYYDLSGGTLNVIGNIVNGDGTGSINVDGGTLNVTGSIDVDIFKVGFFPGSNGSFTLESGQSLNASSETIGEYGTGTFTQSGGTHTVGSNLVLGQNVGSFGEYNLSGGTLLSSYIGGGYTVVGENGTGVFNQTGGTNTSSWPVLGRNVGSYGEYNLSGGILDGGLTVGEAGMGVFTNSGGTHNVSGNLLLGYQSTGDGTYNLLSGGILANSARTIVGMDGTGTFNQSGGTHDATGLRVGQRTGTGIYNLSGGDLNVTVQTVVGGKLGLATGTFNQTGGTLTTTGETVIGYYGTGTFNQSNGSHTTGSMVIGQETGSTGTYNYSGGTLTIADLYVGLSGHGTLNLLYAPSDITVSNLLSYGTNSTFTAVPGAAIHMTGSAFENQSTNPDNLADLINLMLVFEGGSGDTDPFEVAGEDMGGSMAGFDNNFALGTLQLGGEAGIGQMQLVDLFDNQPLWEGSEALYVQNLILGSGSYLDLNGSNLYYLDFTDLGGTINLNGGSLTFVPEPATLGLLVLGGLALLRRRRK